MRTSASNFVYAVATLTLSGSYPSGGDTLDFATVADKLPTTKIVQVFTESQYSNGGYYVPVQGSAMNNWKLKAFAGGGTELTAGAYPASVRTDIVQPSLTARKLLQFSNVEQLAILQMPANHAAQRHHFLAIGKRGLGDHLLYRPAVVKHELIWRLDRLVIRLPFQLVVVHGAVNLLRRAFEVFNDLALPLSLALQIA